MWFERVHKCSHCKWLLAWKPCLALAKHLDVSLKAKKMLKKSKFFSKFVLQAFLQDIILSGSDSVGGIP